MIFSISRSSTALSGEASISPLACWARACFSAAGRSRLPTMSARKGGVVRCIDLLRDYQPRVANRRCLMNSIRYSLFAIRSLAPNLLGHFHDHAQLGPLLVLGQHVAFLGRGKTALRRPR